MQKQEITPQNSLYSLLTRNSKQWNCSEKRLESAVQKVLNCCFVQVPFFLSLTHNCCKWHDLNSKHMFMDSFWRLGWPLRTLSGLMFWHWSIHNSSNCIMSLRNETSLMHFKQADVSLLQVNTLLFIIYNYIPNWSHFCSCILLTPWNVLHFW